MFLGLVFFSKLTFGTFHTLLIHQCTQNAMSRTLLGFLALKYHKQFRYSKRDCFYRVF